MTRMNLLRCTGTVSSVTVFLTVFPGTPRLPGESCSLGQGAIASHIQCNQPDTATHRRDARTI
jgi:hypothetical protein